RRSAATARAGAGPGISRPADLVPEISPRSRRPGVALAPGRYRRQPPVVAAARPSHEAAAAPDARRAGVPLRLRPAGAVEIPRDAPLRVRAWRPAVSVGYSPAESTTGSFGGNSNWRGPVWMPVNYLLIEALHRFHQYYGDDFTVECPVGSGKFLNLRQVADELSRRLTRLFLRGPD